MYVVSSCRSSVVVVFQISFNGKSQVMSADDSGKAGSALASAVGISDSDRVNIVATWVNVIRVWFNSRQGSTSVSSSTCASVVSSTTAVFILQSIFRPNCTRVRKVLYCTKVLSAALQCYIWGKLAVGISKLYRQVIPGSLGKFLIWLIIILIWIYTYTNTKPNIVLRGRIIDEKGRGAPDCTS